jgi:hypothetical protein
MAPETAAHAPKAASAAPASEPKAVVPRDTAASALIAALTRNDVPCCWEGAVATEATTSISG